MFDFPEKCETSIMRAYFWLFSQKSLKFEESFTKLLPINEGLSGTCHKYLQVVCSQSNSRRGLWVDDWDAADGAQFSYSKVWRNSIYFWIYMRTGSCLIAVASADRSAWHLLHQLNSIYVNIILKNQFNPRTYIYDRSSNDVVLSYMKYLWSWFDLFNFLVRQES